MQKKVNGNTEGIRDAVLERIAAIYDMTQGQYEFASHELIAELCALTGAIRREISVYISRSGSIEDVSVGDGSKVSMPSMRLVRNEDRLCGVRCLHTHPGGDGRLSGVDIGTLRSMRLDCMAAVGVKEDGAATSLYAGYIGEAVGEEREALVYGPLSVAYGMGGVLLTLALGIYQAYLSLASGLFVAYLIRKAMEREWSWRRMLRCGIWCLAVLAGGLALYFAVNKLVMTLTATQYNAYAAASITAEGLGGLLNAYGLFFKGILYRYLLFVPTRFSRLLHLLLIGITALVCLHAFIREMDMGKRIIVLLLFIIYPLSVNCLAAVTPGQHTVEYFSFYALYVIFASLADCAELPKCGSAARDAAAVLLALLVCVNTVFSNMVFLKQRLVYEESYGLGQQLVSRIKALPDYTGGERVVIAGRASGAIYTVPEISMWNIPAVRDEVISIYSRDRLLRDYLGLDEYVEDVKVRNVDFGFDADEAFMELYVSMPAFPAEGSVIKRGGDIIVKLE